MFARVDLVGKPDALGSTQPGKPAGQARQDPAQVTALAFSDQVLNGHLPPQIEIQPSRTRAAELAHTAGALVNLCRIAEQRLAVPVVIISHWPVPASRSQPAPGTT